MDGVHTGQLRPPDEIWQSIFTLHRLPSCFSLFFKLSDFLKASLRFTGPLLAMDGWQRVSEQV